MLGPRLDCRPFAEPVSGNLVHHRRSPMKTHTSNVTIEIVTGDIASQDDVEAVVNAANAQLQMGGGVAGAIHRGAGPKLAEETRPLAPIQPGEAVITGGYELPNDHVIHVLGPVYGRDEPSDELLRAGYENALRLAEENDIASIAFPAISTGAFGFPLASAARIALRTVLEHAPSLSSVEHVRFVLFDDETRRVHENALEELAGEMSE
jgi:O-acetyl-ADP-ribose deacetylase (regulator of RNase III)